ncbi:MAG: hypothetical protein JWM19_6993 [Actinomycetia bacterium]|nr:hypothetical protein [Actinomycetes bacterium]
MLLLPSVSVLPVDQVGQLLLVRQAGHDDGWSVLGGARVTVAGNPVAFPSATGKHERGQEQASRESQCQCRATTGRRPGG